MEIDNIWSDRPEVSLYASRHLQQSVRAPATFVFMDGRRNPVQHIAHAPVIGDEMDFTYRGIFALRVDEMSHGTAYTTLAPFYNMSYS